MSAFKKFDRKDVFVGVLNTNRAWNTSGSALSTYGIEIKNGTTGSFPDYTGSQEFTELLNFRSIRHLYYMNFISSSLNGLVPTGSFENYYYDYSRSGSRELENNVSIFSFPRDIIGTAIRPGTFRLDLDEAPYIINEPNYVDESVSEYVDDPDGYPIHLFDDGFGNLKTSVEAFTSSPNTRVGDIIYPHGVAVITKEGFNTAFTSTNPEIAWESTYPVFTSNYYCKVKDSEFNFTFNPSAITGSNGTLRDNITGSEFRPYITTIGLYNDANELLGVAKLGRPTPKSSDTDMTFVVKLDI